MAPEDLEFSAQVAWTNLRVFLELESPRSLLTVSKWRFSQKEKSIQVQIDILT